MKRSGTAELRPKLRVGMVSSFMPPHLGGLEVAAKEVFEAYVAAGCDVLWVASRVPEKAMAREEGLVRVNCWNGLERWHGVPWPVWGPAGVREVARLVQWADLLHVHDCVYMGSALTAFLARRVRKPVLLSQHVGFVRYSSLILNGLERFAYQTLGRAVLRRISHIVFVSPVVEEFVKEVLGGLPAAASNIPYGIHTKRFRPPTPAERAAARQDLGLAESSWVVLFVGRLVEKKGVDLFLEVSRRMPSCHFLMVGDGPLRPASASNLTWLPFVPLERMETVYQAADALLVASHSESFCLAAYEAMAVGLPVILPKGAAFTAWLEHDGACLLVKRTPAAFCEAVRHLQETPELAAEIGARSRELVMRDYTVEAMRARYVTLIHSLAGRELSPAPAEAPLRTDRG